MKELFYKKYYLLILLSLALPPALYAQTMVYPPYWWVGMENDTLELLVYNPDGFKKAPAISKEVKLIESKLATNKMYAFVKINIAKAEAGSFKIGKGKEAVNYELKERSDYSPKGLNPADAMYLITPDRFANGDQSNDAVKGMNEEMLDRSQPFARHGGDLKGITSKLDYIKELGFNSLWICPVLTNDQPEESYHGYAITDHYNIDPRFGNLEDYRNLMKQMRSRDMKMVMDVVYNHFGTEHHLFKDLPDSSFFNFHKGFDAGYQQTNYRAASLFDPHASQSDREQFTDGWFVRTMPDVNQRNPHMAEFLIQNSIWWIEEFGIDAFRIDTYSYPDQKFMGELAGRIKQEYPDFFIFGETWVHYPEIQSYFPEGARYNPVNSNMDAVTDFTLCFAIQEAMNTQQGWTEGISKVYYRLAADYLYENPDQLVTFLDNHDLARIYGHYGENWPKLKTALGMLFTLRGIPCMYYGTEILMKETANHGVIREDFPGGWENDTVNKFVAEDRTELENETFDWIKLLLDYRSDSKALTEGKLTQFVPVDGIYVYFRNTDDETIMVIVNTNQKDTKALKLDRFAELWPKGSTGVDITTQQKIGGEELNLAPMSILIVEKD